MYQLRLLQKQNKTKQEAPPAPPPRKNLPPNNIAYLAQQSAIQAEPDGLTSFGPVQSPLRWLPWGQEALLSRCSPGLAS